MSPMHQIETPEFVAPDTNAAVDPVVVHDVTAEERTEIVALAGTLTGPDHPLVDTPQWLSAALNASSLLPRTLLRALRAFRHDPGPQGTLMLRGLPMVAGEQLPPTPGSRTRWSPCPRPPPPSSPR